MKTLLAASQNPKGRTIVQTDDYVYVLSECCEAAIFFDTWNRWVDSTGKYKTGVWMTCSFCKTGLEENERKWITKINVQDQLDFGGGGWQPWGRYMLGLEDFEMRFRA